VLDWRVSLFEWDEANLQHIAAHGVSAAEAEEALLLSPLELDSYIIDGEQRFEDAGETAAGRILKVISVLRGDAIRVVTAFDASAHTKRIYLESKIKQ
jgi:uncharacterized DUF497 family protein